MSSGVHYFLALVVTLAFSTIDARAQADVPVVSASALDLKNVQREDSMRSIAGDLPLYGRLMPVMADVNTYGTWDVDKGDRRWRLWLRSEGAKAVELFFDGVSVPAGATLTVFDQGGALSNGPHGADEMTLPGGLFTTGLVHGDRCLVEYREPLDAAFRGFLRITHVSHAYRDVMDSSCEVDAACMPEGAGWEDAAAATVRISVIVPQGAGWCSGTLVNNVREDCTPYILSAWHCGSGSTPQQFALYKFYFGYQRSACGSGSAPANHVLTGAQLRAYSNDNGGTTGSDFMLLEATQPVPSTFTPYWSGWDAGVTSTSTADGVCIHHPMALPKKISTYTQTLTSGHWNLGIQSHWKVYWTGTANGHGVTEQGSSGSGLFKRDAKGMAYVIGHLSGGSVSCDNPTPTTYFGKVSYDWTGNANTAAQKLKYWLDPDGTGTLLLSGSADPCAVVSAVVEEEIPFQALAIFPNPVSEKLIVRMEVPAMMDFQILDTTGRLVRSGVITEEGTGIDVSGFSNGLYYFLAYATGSSPVSTHFVIAH